MAFPKILGYSKYLAIAVTLLMTTGAIPISYALPSGVLAPNQVDTHGPLLDKVLFSSISSDSTLYSDLAAGTIQGPEWSFTTGSYLSAQGNSNLYANKTTTYTFDGFGFNMLRPVTNTTAFRRAIVYLIDYSFLQSTVLSGVAGSAQPDLYYSAVYPTVYNPNVRSYTYDPSLVPAVAELKLAGLTEGNTSDVGNSNIPWLYKGSPFTPNLYYRSDDPLRTLAAVHLVNQAAKIGLQFNAKGISGSQAGKLVYGPSAAAGLSPGVYNSSTGFNSPPKFNYTAAAGNGPDSWDIYTFGWIVSPDFNWAWSFFNTQLVGTTLNFINYYNTTMDKDTNTMEYSSSIATSTAAGKQVAADFMNDLPYVMMFYTNQLYAVYLKGWSGYADLPSTGPMETTGLYYSLLNLHPTGSASGGTFNYAIHQVPDILTALYNTNWVWQIDIWSEIYDTPIAVPPTNVTTALAYINWMTTNYSVAPFTGSTQTGPGWFQTQGPQNVSNKIGSSTSPGQVITFNFYKNITFTDHVPLTANDYNFSLYAANVAGSLSSNGSPFGFTEAGSSGMWATYIPPNNPYQLQIYINSNSVWNILNVIVPTLPQHIFKYFNMNTVWTSSTTMDTTLPYSQATASSACGSPCNFLAPGVTTVPTWLQYLPNLEVGQGPFWLRAYSGSTGAGELDRNVNYYRSAWMKTGANLASGTSSYKFSTVIQEWIYNQGGTFSGIASNQVGAVPITNATGTATLQYGNGTKIQTVNLSGGTGGNYTATFNTASLADGHYEVVTNATYTFLGLSRVWYQATGLCIGSGCSGVIAPPPPPPNYTVLIVGIVVVIAVVVGVAAYLVRRRGRTGS